MQRNGCQPRRRHRPGSFLPASDAVGGGPWSIGGGGALVYKEWRLSGVLAPDPAVLLLQRGEHLAEQELAGLAAVGRRRREKEESSRFTRSPPALWLLGRTWQCQRHKKWLSHPLRAVCNLVCTTHEVVVDLAVAQVATIDARVHKSHPPVATPPGDALSPARRWNSGA